MTHNENKQDVIIPYEPFGPLILEKMQRILEEKRRQAREADLTLEQRAAAQECLKKLERQEKALGIKGDEQISKARSKWYHAQDEPIPPRFYYGPLLGTMKDLDHAVGGKGANGRQIKGKNERGTLWVVRRQRTTYQVWFTSQPDFDAAHRRLEAIKVSTTTGHRKTESRK